VIRLLVADDSALMRKLLETIFVEEGDFDVRLARNGAEALELVRSFDPQVVTLDVQMPGMDGLTCLGRIMIESPRPVVMISALTEEGTEATLEAIELGAVDFVAKPGGTVSLEIDRLRPLLVEKVRAAAQARIRPTLRLTERIRHKFRGVDRPARPVRPAAAPPPPRRARPKRSAGIGSEGLVLIGTSTGGPAALDLVLPRLPADFPWPVLVAQHMPATVPCRCSPA
jgi:two-component system chemotaxis response regulator CheB